MEKKSKEENLSSYIDKNVTMLMIVVLLLSTSILSFKIINYYPCEDVDILLEEEEFRVGELITFETSINVERELLWDFGDSITMSNVNKISHSFDKPGTYNISLNINGGTCEKFQEIVVLDKKILIDPTKIPWFELPDEIYVGEELVVLDTNTTIRGEKWEWNFGETAKNNSENNIARYTYEKSGTKTVTLIVNGDITHMASKTINVFEKEEDPEEDPGGYIPPTIVDTDTDGIPDKPEGWEEKDNIDPEPVEKRPFLSSNAFKETLIKVVKKELSEREFQKYFCDGNIDVPIYDGKKKTTFQDFCLKYKDKKIRIKELEIYRKDGGNCIESLTIDVRRGRW